MGDLQFLPFVPAKAGTQPLVLDSRFRGNERSLLHKERQQ